VSISLPAWLSKFYDSLAKKEFRTDEEMMTVAVEISAKNVEYETGGPFGCAIFERCKSTGISKLFAVGANRVTALNNSTLHGEMVAIQFAQLKLGTYSMRMVGQQKNKDYVMCTSCEPCAMCLGGIFWSGIDEMICSATKNDAEAIGFDEGPVFEESYNQLVASGVKVKRKVLRDMGASILKKYGETGVIYNS
jgi:tRNA(Arg) A34 adenosine deaminase TadA